MFLAEIECAAACPRETKGPSHVSRLPPLGVQETQGGSMRKGPRDCEAWRSRPRFPTTLSQDGTGLGGADLLRVALQQLAAVLVADGLPLGPAAL